MKILSLVIGSLLITQLLIAQNVGIGTTNPVARLHVADSNVVFTGPSVLPTSPRNPPVSGPGTRLMWYPDKAAFRVGYVTTENWNKDSIGQYSFAANANTKAKGYASFAINIAKADGIYSTAMGNSTAYGHYSTSFGVDTKAYGNYSTSMGENTIARSPGSLAIGNYNDTSDINSTFNSLQWEDRLFQIGNGYPGTRTNAMTVLRNGNIGIGTVNPVTKLHVSYGSSGAWWSYSPLAVEGNNNTYINMLSPADKETGILFGRPGWYADGGIVYNNVDNRNGLQFRTNGNENRMVINDFGNIGVGNTDPAYLLDVNNRMRLRSGGGVNSAGIWFNNNANTEAAFLGMEDDTHIGFFGNSPAGWKFTMNTETGALKVNGSEGSPGQVLQSNGSAAPTWTNNPATDMYNLTEEISSTGQIVLAASQSGDVPGLSKTLVLNKTSKVIVQFMVRAITLSCVFCGSTSFAMHINLNGSNPGDIWKVLVNGIAEHVIGTRIFTLSPGTHIIKISGWNQSGPNVQLGTLPGGVNGSFMTIQVIPQN